MASADLIGDVFKEPIVHVVIGSSVWGMQERMYFKLLEAIADGRPVTYAEYGTELGPYKGDITYIDKFSARQELDRA